jgi:hypothetical protein
MGSPIPGDKRSAILADIEAGELACRAIARKHNVAPSTVTKIAKDAGITDAFGRSQTKDATAARKTDLAAQRAEVSALFLQRAREALQEMTEPHLVFSFGGRDNSYNEQLLDSPPTTDKRNLMTIAAIGMQRHLEVERHDTAAEADQVGSLLGQLLGTLQARHGDGG